MKTVTRREAGYKWSRDALTQQHLAQYEFFMCLLILLLNEARKKAYELMIVSDIQRGKNPANLSINVIEWDGDVPIAAA